MTSCHLNDPTPTNVKSGLELPVLRVFGEDPLRVRISFWYVFLAIPGDTRSFQLLANLQPVWAAVTGQSAIWRYAEISITRTEDTTLLFSVDHARCVSPTALDTVTIEQGKSEDGTSQWKKLMSFFNVITVENSTVPLAKVLLNFSWPKS